MASPNKQKLSNSKSEGSLDTVDTTRNAPGSHFWGSRVFSSLRKGGRQLFDLLGSFAVLFMLIDLCFVWYFIIVAGGTREFVESIPMLHLELLFVAPLAIMWVMTKIRGWI